MKIGELVRLEDFGYSRLHVATDIDGGKFNLEEIDCGKVAIITGLPRKGAVQVLFDGKIRYVNPEQCMTL